MAQETITFCDRHLAKGERVMGAQYVVGVDLRWQTMDLCEECHDEILGQVIGALAEWGKRLQGPPPRPQRGSMRPSLNPTGMAGNDLDTLLDLAAVGTRRGQQPEGDRIHPCLWCALDYAKPSGLKGHLLLKHSIVGDQMAIFGNACPLCGHESKAPGQHTLRAHELTVTQAFRAAAEQGDPHGIVAQVIQKGRVAAGGIVLAASA